MRDHRQRWPVAVMADAFEGSTSGSYAWVDRPLSSRRQQRAEVQKAVIEAFRDSHESYGSRKIATELGARNVRACRSTIQMIMHAIALESRAQKSRRFASTTDSDHENPAAPDTLARDFSASASR